MNSMPASQGYIVRPCQEGRKEGGGGKAKRGEERKGGERERTEMRKAANSQGHVAWGL